MVSAFAGLVLYLCHDLSCLITESRFWYFCSNSRVTFSVVGGKVLSTSSFGRGIVQVGHED